MPIDFVDIQEKIAQSIVSEMSTEVDWDQIEADYSSAGRFTESTCRYVASDSRKSFFFPDDAARLAADLRDAMSGPHGTWFSFRLTIQSNGSFSFDFNYDDEPPWRTRPSDETLILDLEQHPRPPEEIPPWHPARADNGSS